MVSKDLLLLTVILSLARARVAKTLIQHQATMPRTTYLLVFGAGVLLGTGLAAAVLKFGAPQLRNGAWQGDSGSNYGTSLYPSSAYATKTPTPLSGLGLMQDDVTTEQFTSLGPAPQVDYDRLIRSIPISGDERNAQFFGFEGQLKVHSSFVVVVGLGGVGSHAAAMLLRSGVAKLRLVDFDQVSLSSLNRHAVATREDVGIAKAVCLKNHFNKIFPESEVEANVELFDASSADKILSGSPDFVLDCIDNIDTKVLLLSTCVKRGLKVVSATGAGARADPTRIRVADLRESSNDPLSRSVRHRLRREHDIDGGLPVVFSTERPKAKLLPFKGPSGEEANPADYQVVPGFRVRIIPVLGTVPAIFGQVMATYVVTQIASMSLQLEPVVNLDVDHYALLHHRLIEREELLFGSAAEVEVDKEEVAYIVRELWHGRSARDQSAEKVGRGMWRSMNTLTLTRWDQTQPPSICNLVLLTFQEAEEHESITLDEVQERDPEYHLRVTNVLQQAYRDFYGSLQPSVIS